MPDCIGLTGALGAHDLKEPALREGIHVDVPVASRAVAMPAADELNATVVTLTTDGKLFLGVRPVEVSELSNLPASIVYVKADAQTPYQQVLTVLNALSGHQVVLLTAPTAKAVPGKMAPPYGVCLDVDEGSGR